MSRVYAWDGIIPVIDPAAFVHPEAVVIGDVHIGPTVYVGPGCVLRGDFGRIILQAGCNVQETCVVHSFPEKDVIVEEFGHIGHGAVLHGCHIGRNAMVGMNAVIMDEAVIGENAIIAAMAFVKAGAQIPANSLAVGSPAKVLRQLTEDEVEWKRRGTLIYQQLAREAQHKLTPAMALTKAERGRKRAKGSDYDPLLLERKNFNEQP